MSTTTHDPIWSMRLHRDAEDNGQYYVITVTEGHYVAILYRDGTVGLYGPDLKHITRLESADEIRPAVYRDLDERFACDRSSGTRQTVHRKERAQ